MTEKETRDITPEEAQRVLQAQRRLRSESFDQELRQLQDKYGYHLVAVPGLTSDGRIVATVQKREAPVA